MRLPAFKSELEPTKPAVFGRLRWPFPAWSLAALLVLVTVALYWPATSGGFVYDDGEYIVNNYHVTSGVTAENLRWAFTKSYSANWHPVTWLSHMVDCQLFGLNPFGHHLSSVLLHSLNTMLVFLFLRSLTNSLWRSFMVAALFGWHPVHVESVAWVAERKDVLSTFFGLLALMFYARYAKRSGTGAQQPPAGIPSFGSWLSADYLLSLLCFTLGLMSKPMLVTWPFVLLLLDYWPLARFDSIPPWRLVKEKIPFFALSAAASVVTFMAQNQATAVVSVTSMSVGIRLGHSLVSYCSYLGKILWPMDLAAFYPLPRYLLIWKVLLAGALLLAITMLLFGQRRRRPFLLMGWLWYCGTLVPVIGLVQVGGQAMADRYTYIPSLGALILIVWGVSEWLRLKPHPGILLSVAGAMAIIPCLAMTRQQIGYWHDNETLFRRALTVTEDNYIAHCNLGIALNEKDRVDEAIVQFQEGIRQNPDDALARINLGVALGKKHQIDAAIREYQAALRAKPDYAEAHNHLGLAYDERGQRSEAMGEYQAAVRLKPDYAQAHYNLGTALFKQEQISEAVSQFQTAIRLKPDYAEAYYNLGVALGKTGQNEAAVSQYLEAIRLKPAYAEARYNLGNTLLKMGRIDAATSQYQEVVRLQPDNAEARNNLGIIFYNKKKIDEAIGQFQEAVRLKPDFTVAQNNLDHALAKKKSLPDH